MVKVRLVLTFLVVSVTLSLFFAAHADAAGLTWWVENASFKVMQDRPPQFKKSIHLEAARNEYEPFQVALRADGGDLVDVDVEISDLVGPNGAVIPAENVDFYRAYYVAVTSPSGQGGQGDGLQGNPREAGEYVDPLIPFFDPYDPRALAVGTPFDIPQNRIQPVFGDIYVPADAPAGVYQGVVTVTVGFVEAAIAPVTLRVFNFTLPFERQVATAYGLSAGRILWYHGGTDGAYDDKAVGIINNYEEILHRFRVDLTNVIYGPPYLPSPFFAFDGNGDLLPPDYTAYDAHLEPRFTGSQYDDGVGAAMANSQLFTPGGGRSYTDDEYAQIAANVAQHLKEKGWWDKIYVYVRDEPWLFPGAYDAIVYDVEVMKMGDPDWTTRMMATNHWVPKLQYSINIWCPSTNNYDHWNSTLPEYGREEYAALRERGQKLWFYICNCTFPPYAGYDIDTVHGHEPRMVQWGAWYEGATGFLYWSTNYWVKNDPWGTLLDQNQFAWAARNGDGFLLYPGNHDGTAGTGVGSPPEIAIDGPIITHRLMMIREGMEDWDYFLIARDMGGEGVAKSLVDMAYTQLGVNPLSYDPANPPWTLDENDMYTVRSLLGQWIEANGQGPPPESDGGHGGCAIGGTGEVGDFAFYSIVFLIVLWRSIGRGGQENEKIRDSRN